MRIERLVFSQDKWITVQVPIGPAWTDADAWIYAVSFAAGKEIGYTELRAEQVAEAIVNNRLYPGILYDIQTEKDIYKILEVTWE